MQNLEFEGLKIDASVDGQTLTLVWVGDIHASNPGEALSPYLEECVEFAIKNSYKVVSNFRELDYMNSASIPPLIQLLRDLGENEIEGVFIYDNTRKVQTASFKALDVIARKSSFTTVIGEA